MEFTFKASLSLLEIVEIFYPSDTSVFYFKYTQL